MASSERPLVTRHAIETMTTTVNRRSLAHHQSRQPDAKVRPLIRLIHNRDQFNSCRIYVGQVGLDERGGWVLGAIMRQCLKATKMSAPHLLSPAQAKVGSCREDKIWFLLPSPRCLCKAFSRTSTPAAISFCSL